MFVFVNYCSDMLRPQFLVIFRELRHAEFMHAALVEKHELPEDGQELRPKHVGALINNNNNNNIVQQFGC